MVTGREGIRSKSWRWRRDVRAVVLDCSKQQIVGCSSGIKGALIRFDGSLSNELLRGKVVLELARVVEGVLRGDRVRRGYPAADLVSMIGAGRIPEGAKGAS